MHRHPGLIVLSLVFAFVAQPALAQTAKPKTPGEIAAADRLKAEKTEACRQKAKQLKLSLMKRRAYIKSCVKE